MAVDHSSLQGARAIPRNLGLANNCQIWQVARATTAAPGLFPLAKFEGREYLDGGFGANNPCHEASMELSSLQPACHSCLISIGSGKRHNVSRFAQSRLLRSLYYITAAVKLATETEVVHENMLDMAARSENFSYFRFDVPGLSDVSMDEWNVKTRKELPSRENMHTIAFIEEQTRKSLGQDDTRNSIHICARIIVETLRLRRDPRSHLKQKNVPSVIQVPARNNDFHGREDCLQHMDEHLNPRYVATGSRLQFYVLYGLGGIGKTQIAVEYIYQYKNQYENVFWVRASSEQELADSYSSIDPIIGHKSAAGTLNVHENI